MNEIDKTVDRIGQLPDDAQCLYVAKDDGTGTRPFLTDKDLKALANAHTQLKADLATAKQGLERIANPINAMQNDLKDGQSLDGAAAVYISNDATWLKSVAQQTLAAIGKE